MRIFIFILFFFCCQNKLIGQLTNKSPVPGQKHIESIIEGYGGGFIGLSTEYSGSYKCLKVVRLDDLLNVSWSFVLFDSTNRNPAFIKQLSNTNLLIGGNTGNGALLLESDTTGNVINKWLMGDSIIIKDALRVSNGATHFVFEKNKYSIPAGNLQSTGKGYINPTGTNLSLYWGPNTSHHEYPVNLVESSSLEPFFITRNESLNYWDCWIHKATASGNLTNNHRYEIAYDAELIRRQNQSYILTGLTILSFLGPAANFFIQLSNSGSFNYSHGIQFLDASNNYSGLIGLKCTESPDGGLFCAGEMDNYIHFFKINSNDSVSWAYKLTNYTSNFNIIKVLNCSDRGFLFEGSNGQSYSLFRCDSNGISTCDQDLVTFSQINTQFFHSSGTNSQLTPLNFTSLSSQFTSYQSNYSLYNICLPTLLNEVNDNDYELNLTIESGQLTIYCNVNYQDDIIPFEVFDLRGRLLFKNYLYKITDNNFTSSNFPEDISKGIYLIKINAGNQKKIKKFVIN